MSQVGWVSFMLVVCVAISDAVAKRTTAALIHSAAYRVVHPFMSSLPDQNLVSCQGPHTAVSLLSACAHLLGYHLNSVPQGLYVDMTGLCC